MITFNNLIINVGPTSWCFYLKLPGSYVVGDKGGYVVHNLKASHFSWLTVVKVSLHKS